MVLRLPDAETPTETWFRLRNSLWPGALTWQAWTHERSIFASTFAWTGTGNDPDRETPGFCPNGRVAA